MAARPGEFTTEIAAAVPVMTNTAAAITSPIRTRFCFHSGGSDVARAASLRTGSGSVDVVCAVTGSGAGTADGVSDAFCGSRTDGCGGTTGPEFLTSSSNSANTSCAA